MRESERVKLIALAGIFLCSICLNTFNLDFPIGFHIDEVKKFWFVESLHQDFRHPVLLLQLGRISTALLQSVFAIELPVACRFVSALAASLLVLVGFFLSERVFGNRRLLLALSLAVSPILVVHAHYFKEDLVFTLCSTFALLRFLLFAKEPGEVNFRYLWVATGLCLAAQYKGVLMFLVFVLARYFMASEFRGVSWERIRRLGLNSFLLALAVNFPLFLNVPRFFGGLWSEISHSVSGHIVKIYPWTFGFTFHLRYSLREGLGLGVLLFALGGLALCLRRWSETRFELKVLVLYTLVFYSAHELTPLKAFPDYSRYIISTVPGFLVLAWHFLFSLGELQVCQRRPLKVLLGFSSLFVMVLLPLQESVHYVLNFHHRDTRMAVETWAQERDGDLEEYLFSRYSSSQGMHPKLLRRLVRGQKLKQGKRYLVVSSFEYGRYEFASTLPQQTATAEQRHQAFQELFRKFHYREFRPAYRSYAFSNPELRVVDTHRPRAQGASEHSEQSDGGLEGGHQH